MSPRPLWYHLNERLIALVRTETVHPTLPVLLTKTCPVVTYVIYARASKTGLRKRRAFRLFRV